MKFKIISFIYLAATILSAYFFSIIWLDKGSAVGIIVLAAIGTTGLFIIAYCLTVGDKK